jgi:V8-like Glu-specific endopeptidase
VVLKVTSNWRPHMLAAAKRSPFQARYPASHLSIRYRQNLGGKQVKRLVVAAALLAALATAPAAMAITYGAPDGNGHPEVGALLAPTAYSDGTWASCTGTLISPTVFLTAAHCDWGVSRLAVTFDSDYNPQTGHTYWGTWHADGRFNKSQSNPYDIAVVVFDQPVAGITPARLPQANSLARLAKDQKFTPVGYGGQSVTNGPGGKTIHYADVRFVATGTLNAINPSWLRISMNPSHGDGGTCYGDSGGPNFLGAGANETNIVAGTTITGDRWCRSTNVDYRMDTASARSFLSAYVTLP